MPAGFPNDAFFKEMFSDPPRAIAFFQSHLPPAIVAKVDWPTLKVLPSSFIKSGLQQVSANLLFNVKIGGVDALLYLLFEHQSTVDPTMPLRMLGYIAEILLLGICFLREAPVRAIGPDRRAGKWGLRGKRGRKRCFGASVDGFSVRKIPGPRW